MQHNGWDHALKVTGDGTGLVGHAGVSPLTSISTKFVNREPRTEHPGTRATAPASADVPAELNRGTARPKPRYQPTAA